MSDLILYGIPQSRAARCLWALEETRLPYENKKVHMRIEAQQPDFLEVNPNGRIPALVDGDFILFESLAINSYIAKKAGGVLAPKDLIEEAVSEQWSMWAMTETEKPLLNAMFHSLGVMGREKDPAIVATHMEELARPLKVLDAKLAESEHLMGGRFTIADLNVASVLAWAKTGRLDLMPYPNVVRWLDACLSREAYGRVKALQKAG